MKLSDMRIDSSKMDNADWVDNIPELQGIRLKVRAADNNDWKRLRLKLINSIPRKNRLNGLLRPEDNDRIFGTLLLETSLVDWDGIENDDGSPLPYSRDTAQKFLMHPDYAKFREGALYAANTVAEQGQDAVEDIAKN